VVSTLAKAQRRHRAQIDEADGNALINAGRIAPYHRAYAKRQPKAMVLLAEIEVQYRDSLFAALPEQDRPTSLSVLMGPKRLKLIVPDQIPL
jgi:hypothetical protein